MAQPNPYPTVLPIFYQFLMIAGGSLVASFFMMGGWMIAGERQGVKCRQQYMAALLRQEIGWFDGQHSSELAAKVASESALLQKAIGEKAGTFIMTLSATVAGIVIAFIYGWQLTLVTFVIFPLVAITAYFFTWMIQNIST